MSLRILGLISLSICLSLCLSANRVSDPALVEPLIIQPFAFPPGSSAAKTQADGDKLVSVEKLTLGAANDNFATAIELVLFGPFSGPESWTKSTEIAIYGDNLGTTKENGEPNHEGQAGGHSVWFKLILPRNARVDFVPQANSTNFTALLGVYKGSTINVLTPVALTYSGSPSPLATRTLAAEAWTTYYVAIDGASGASGNFYFQMYYDPLSTAPDNDNFSRARDITGSINPTPSSLYSLYGDNLNATKETGEPNSAGHSVWWKWTSPANTRAFLNASASDFAANLGIYTGTNVSALIAANPNAAVQAQALSFDAVAGNTYYIMADGTNGSTGNIHILVSFLAADQAPVITKQPADLTLPSNGNGQLQLILSGGAVTKHQWYRNGVPYNGSTGPTYVSFSQATSNDAGAYYVVLSNSWGSVTSATANVTVTDTFPAITVQPKSQNNAVGNSIQLYVTAIGESPLTYQWFYNGTAITSVGGTISIPGITDISGLNHSNTLFTSLFIQSATTAVAGSYTVTVTNRLGSVTSSPAIVTVGPPPVITTHPANQTVRAGGSVTFTVAATSNNPLSYAWNFNGQPIQPTVNSPSLQLANLQAANVGSYSVTVSNAGGSVLSQSASLQLESSPTSPPSSGSSSGGGGAPSVWFLAALATLLVLHRKHWLNAR